MGKRKNGGAGGKDKKRQRCHALIEPGQYGIYASCARFKEVAAAKEMRLLLLDAIEKHYPKEEEEQEQDKAEEEENEENAETGKVDIEDEIAKELAEMKKNDDRSKHSRNNKDLVLREIPLGVESLTFFKLRQPVTPSDLVVSLCKDLHESGAKTGRFVQKLVPIDRSCNATKPEFDKLLAATLDAFVERETARGGDAKAALETYNVNLIKRNFDTISRDEFMATVKAQLDTTFGEGSCRLQYKGAKTLLNIYCFKNNIGMSVVSNAVFEELAKFNVQQIFDKACQKKAESEENPEKPSRPENGDGEKEKV